MGKKANSRIAGYELLRIIAMMMVVMLHFNSRTGSLVLPGEWMNGAGIMAGFLEALCLPAVNVYVLLGAYFLSETSFKAERILRLEIRILFYSLLIPLILILFGVPVRGTGVWESAVYLFPVLTEHYWFVTAYVFMLLFSPVLNAAAERMSRRQLKSVILLLLLYFCFFKSVIPLQFVTDHMGYDFGWFLCLYLIAAYFRKYGFGRLEGAAASGGLYAVCTILIFALHMGLNRLSEAGLFTYYASVPFHYNSILCLASAAGLFALFRHVQLKEDGRAEALVRALAPHTFSVYLIHEHVDIRDRWAGIAVRLTGGIAEDAPFAYLGKALLAVLLVFIICVVIDCGRSMLLRLLKKSSVLRRTVAALRRAERNFYGDED